MTLPWLPFFLRVLRGSGCLVGRGWEQKGLYPWSWPSKCLEQTSHAGFGEESGSNGCVFSEVGAMLAGSCQVCEVLQQTCLQIGSFFSFT